MMRKFKVEVVRTDEFIVEIDDSIYNKEWRKTFAEAFWPLENTEAIAEDLAVSESRLPYHHKEGYGFVKRDGKVWYPNHDRSPAEGLNIIVVDQDNQNESNVTEIKQNPNQL